MLITLGSLGIVTAVAEPAPVAAVVTPGFSDPVWWPLRDPALTSCAVTNCQRSGSDYHGYFAIDWVDADAGSLNPTHDPVHAAGSGILRVGNVDPGCRTSGDEGRQGTWVWIDHGGGVASYYGHLDEITAVDGQWVDPSVQIGTMGSSGSQCGGGENLYYLHFEIRTSGYWGGVRQEVPPMKACVAGRTKTYPADLPGNWTQWDQILLEDRLEIPATDNSCLPDSYAVPATPQNLSAVIRSTSLEMSWAAPVQPVDETVVSIELWSPAALKYGYPNYTSIDPAATSHTFAGLIEGRQYRIKVAFRNGVGSSRWPAPLVRTTGTVPDAPTTRYVNEYTRSISYGWTKPAHHGYPISGYQVAIRRRVGDSWSSWSYARTTEGYRRYDDLISGRTYQFKVRALNAMGWSRWSRVASGVPG